MAAVTILIVDMPPRRLLRIQAQLSVTLSPFHLASAANRDKRDAASQNRSEVAQKLHPEMFVNHLSYTSPASLNFALPATDKAFAGFSQKTLVLFYVLPSVIP
jgi:hypothetical protein